jgi:hypothetical protein
LLFFGVTTVDAEADDDAEDEAVADEDDKDRVGALDFPPTGAEVNNEFLAGAAAVERANRLAHAFTKVEDADAPDTRPPAPAPPLLLLLLEPTLSLEDDDEDDDDDCWSSASVSNMEAMT